MKHIHHMTTPSNIWILETQYNYKHLVFKNQKKKQLCKNFFYKGITQNNLIIFYGQVHELMPTSMVLSTFLVKPFNGHIKNIKC